MAAGARLQRGRGGGGGDEELLVSVARGELFGHGEPLVAVRAV